MNSKDGKLTIEDMQQIMEDVKKSGGTKPKPVFVDYSKTIGMPSIGDGINRNGMMFSEEALRKIQGDLSKLPKTGHITAADPVNDVNDLISKFGSPMEYPKHEPRQNEWTLAELMLAIKGYGWVEDVQIVYDMAPDEVAIVITHVPGMTPIHRVLMRFEEMLSRTVLTDYNQLEWTFRAKGVMKFDHSVQRETGRDESDVQQQARPEGHHIGHGSYLERYGVGIISTNSVIRTGPISTD